MKLITQIFSVISTGKNALKCLMAIAILSTIISCGASNDDKTGQAKSDTTAKAPEKAVEDTAKYSEYYPTALEIAEGLSFSIKEGMAASDPKLGYTLSTTKGVFSNGDYEWPIVDVKISIDSKILNSPVITYKILLEENKKDGAIVGTVKLVRVDGKENAALKVLENTMYIVNDDGTQQVNLDEAGNVQIVQ